MIQKRAVSASPLALLRAELKKRKLAGFIVPRQDEFQGEYVAAYAERLKWLTGFAGSWGMAIVAAKKAAIFVDGRYTIQVRQQVNVKDFEPQHLTEQPPTAWIAKTFKKGDALGFDPWLMSANETKRLSEACAKVGAKFVAVASNPVDAVWQGQPQRPTAAITVQPTQFAGRSAADKLKDMSKTMAPHDAVVLTQPDSVAWIFNLRGFDVPYTPVVCAYAILHRKGKADLFIDASKVPEDVRDHLKRIAVVRKPADIAATLKALGKKKSSVLLDPGSAPEAIRAALTKSGAKILTGSDPCVLPKARKNSVEQEGARAAQRRDGAAVSRFLHWLEGEAPKGALTEMKVADKLEAFRQETGQLLDLSFDTISAAGPHAAIPHYSVSQESSLPLELNRIFLVDSGAQYQDGTTDITRTVIVGQPTDEMCDRFTRVLKGMIGISRLRFPKGTCGSQIDVLARQHLWAASLDYDHGTGHGVGSYLSVHEGPARINKLDRTPLEAGMILSNEPGYYKQDDFGIRIENLLLVHEAKAIAGGDRPMLGFETLTLAPIERRLINRHLLTKDEVIWIDAYHARVRDEVGNLLNGEDLAWLKKVCAAIE